MVKRSPRQGRLDPEIWRLTQPYRYNDYTLEEAEQRLEEEIRALNERNWQCKQRRRGGKNG